MTLRADYAQILRDRARARAEAIEADGRGPIGLAEYRAQQAISAWRKRRAASDKTTAAIRRFEDRYGDMLSRLGKR